MKNRSKKIMVILAIVIVLIIASIVIPMIVKGGSSSAQKAQVLSGKTFTSDVAGVAVQGGMQNFGDAVLTKQVDAEGEDYIATIDLDDGYYESIQINAKPIYDAGVAEGTASLTGGNAGASHILKDKTAYVNGKLVTGSMATLTSSNFSGTHSGTDAGATSKYTVKSTSAGYVANGTTVNSISATTSPEIATTSATGVQTINIKPGYYNKIKVNQTNAYNKGKTDGATTHTGTYTFPANDTGETKDLGENHSYRYVNATNVYNKGKADGASGKKTVTYLGTGRSFNIKSKLPSVYSSLTADNFIVGISSIPKNHAYYTCTDKHRYGSAWNSASTAVTKSYNKSTGILTLSGGTFTINTFTDESNSDTQADASTTVTATLFAYAIY